MKNIKLGDQIYEGVETVRLDTAEGGTVDFAPYDETFAAGRTEGYNAGKEAGLEEGFDNGKQEGYAEGKTDGHAEGYAEGKTDGHAEGYAEGKEDGIQTEYDRFWDVYQNKGKAKRYNHAFAGFGWASETFRPKYDIIATGDCRHMFAEGSYNNFDLAERLRSLNVILDTSGATNLQNMFQYQAPMKVPEISTVGCNSVTQIFYNALVNCVENLVLRDDGSQTIGQIAPYTVSLSELRITGTIGKDANFSANPLDVASMKSVITHLKNYSGTADAAKYTVKFSDACWTALETDGTLAPDGNTWRDYVETTLGWLT